MLDNDHQGFNLEELTTDNFLFAFDFEPPKTLTESSRILFIHSAPIDMSEICLSRLMNLYPEAEFIILKKAGTSFPQNQSKRISFLTYTEQTIPEDLFSSASEKRLISYKIDLVFFCVSCNCNYFVDRFERYKNITECLKQAGYSNISYGIDTDYRVYPLSAFTADTKPWKVNGETLHLPCTYLFHEEIEAIFELARFGTGKGAIVNLGHFLGGTAITLAKGAKWSGAKEKVYSFDNVRYNWTTDLWRENQVEDCIIFNQMESKAAAKEWGKREDTSIRLLFIDTDHSYEDCIKDIISWSPYLSADGIIAVHDYTSFPGVVRAVHDSILSNPNYKEFRQVKLTFIAKKAL